MPSKEAKTVAIIGTLFFWLGGTIYGFLYYWNFTADVDYTTKYGYHGQLPLGVILVMTFIAGLVWGLVVSAFAERRHSPRRR